MVAQSLSTCETVSTSWLGTRHRRRLGLVSFVAAEICSVHSYRRSAKPKQRRGGFQRAREIATCCSQNDGSSEGPGYSTFDSTIEAEDGNCRRAGLVMLYGMCLPF